MNAGTDLARDIQTGFLNRLALTPLRGSPLLTGQLAGVVVLAQACPAASPASRESESASSYAACALSHSAMRQRTFPSRRSTSGRSGSDRSGTSRSR